MTDQAGASGGPDQRPPIEKSVTIGRPAAELYDFWRSLERLNELAPSLCRVTVRDRRRSHWSLRAPGGPTIEWDAEVTEDVPHDRIAWRAQTTAGLEHHGAIYFRPVRDGQETEVKVMMRYDDRAAEGADLVKKAGGDPTAVAREALRRFKQLMEAGEVPITAGQPSGRAEGAS